MRFRYLLPGVAVLGLAAGAQAQKVVQAPLPSHVYETAQLEPTEDRIANLKKEPGFSVSVFAGMQNPRMIAVAKDGAIYISQREPGSLVMLKDTNGDGRADVQKVVATRKQLHGVAVHNNWVYFITIRELYRAPRKADGTLGRAQLLIKDLPDAGQHPNRTLGFGPDGKLYITVGSTCNACDEKNEENATIIRADANGKNRKVYATGLRNTIGFGWSPVSRRMYGWDHGIDTLGDDTQREEFNEIKKGKRYGWPYVYEDGKINPHPKPPPAYTPAMWAAMSQAPVLTYTAHSAPMQMAFYTGKQFPAQYRNDAFSIMRGSWNRNPPSGYEIVRVHFNAAGVPVSVRPFVSGFLLPNAAPGGKAGHIARLAGIAVAKDGALLVADDTNNLIYRVSYKSPARSRTSALNSRKISLDVPETNSPQSIAVRSAAFPNNGVIGFHHTAYGKNQSPGLSWTGVPRNAKSLVLMMEDPVAMSPKPFVHWLVANIPASAKGLRSGLPNTDRLPGMTNAIQGSSYIGKPGYFGPKPPADGMVHKYHFQVFALNTRLTLPSGYNRQALLDKMRGHVIAKGEVVGEFKRGG